MEFTGAAGEESLESYQIDRSGALNSGVRTFFIFTDLPQHLEYRAGEMPLIPEWQTITLDLSLRNPRNPTKVRRVQGDYQVSKQILKYSSSDRKRMGLTQYLELSIKDSSEPTTR